KNGRLISAGLANMKPTNNGLIDAPIVRATPAIPAAAERSSGVTTAMRYDCLVGTSIWLMLNRARSTTAASGNVGIRGTRMRRRLDGICVATMVVINPNREARRDASSAESRR